MAGNTAALHISHVPLSVCQFLLVLCYLVLSCLVLLCRVLYCTSLFFPLSPLLSSWLVYLLSSLLLHETRRDETHPSTAEIYPAVPTDAKLNHLLCSAPTPTAPHRTYYFEFSPDFDLTTSTPQLDPPRKGCEELSFETPPTHAPNQITGKPSCPIMATIVRLIYLPLCSLSFVASSLPHCRPDFCASANKGDISNYYRCILLTILFSSSV